MKFEDYDAARGSFRQWIFGLAKNVLMEAFRKLQREPRGDQSTFDVQTVPEECTAISRRVARNEGIAAFMKRAASLPRDDRELLVLRGLEGQTHDRIAVQLGITTEAANKRWVRLRDRLREEGLPEGVLCMLDARAT